ncbi:protein of unknown function [endosymbiont DhMRE of Dentiscutata heterogama]|uniref:hypothetical protein n=1 Tax=endosymbiont DhMRE of Dentiscutata heterogama TaxID=1609546 RepID=UPI000629D821|nr:hypothetical protein [endosymbiont DhMRE of Dentiscutata heterogama]CFW93390.1 protein of unknown function [endosymbiont DhMRE of Dentiscutata heterogama]
MASYNYREEVIKAKDDVLLLYRKIQNQIDNTTELGGEAEILYNDFLFCVDQAKNEELEPEDAAELKEILQEVNNFRQSLGLWG